MASILLVDDDPHQRAYAALVLGEAGHSVREASDGQEALRMALEQPPELIVCDVVMPGMNGYQFVSEVRSRDSICTTPFMLLTSLAERTQVRVGMTSGADDYLVKPFRPHDLLDAVNALLARRERQTKAIAGNLDAALQRQREQLASRYESRLLREINTRWKAYVEAGGEMAFGQALVLAADVFALVEREAAERKDAGEVLRRALQAAGDALYLFGAAAVVPRGDDVIGVFPLEEGDTLEPVVRRAVRGAFALQSALSHLLTGESGWQGCRLCVTIGTGPLSVLRLQDPLHGDGGLAIVPSPTVQALASQQQVARGQGWPVSISASLASSVAPDVASTASSTGSGRGKVTELVRPSR
jgi:CheY-like chemotaxis protein